MKNKQNKIGVAEKKAVSEKVTRPIDILVKSPKVNAEDKDVEIDIDFYVHNGSGEKKRG